MNLSGRYELSLNVTKPMSYFKFEQYLHVVIQASSSFFSFYWVIFQLGDKHVVDKK